MTDRPLHPPALLIHGAAELAAAEAAAGGRPFAMLSAEGAACSLGARAWLALAGGRANILCCGAAPGHALAAMRAGARLLVLDGRVPGFGQVAGAATESGAVILPARPPALDLRGLDLRHPGGRARLLAWLCAPSPHDSTSPLG